MAYYQHLIQYENEHNLKMHILLLQQSLLSTLVFSRFFLKNPESPKVCYLSLNNKTCWKTKNIHQTGSISYILMDLMQRKWFFMCLFMDCILLNMDKNHYHGHWINHEMKHKSTQKRIFLGSCDIDTYSRTVWNQKKTTKHWIWWKRSILEMLQNKQWWQSSMLGENWLAIEEKLKSENDLFLL